MYPSNPDKPHLTPLISPGSGCSCTNHRLSSSAGLIMYRASRWSGPGSHHRGANGYQLSSAAGRTNFYMPYFCLPPLLCFVGMKLLLSKTARAGLVCEVEWAVRALWSPPPVCRGRCTSLCWQGASGEGAFTLAC